MKTISSFLLAAAVLVGMGSFTRVCAQTYANTHWINDQGLSAVTVLNTNGTFITDFKTFNDLTVTQSGETDLQLYTDPFYNTTGTNPFYITNYVGTAAMGTGNGSPGNITDLEMTYNTTGTMTFTFADPLLPHDKILVIDIDGPEAYILTAYSLVGSNYVQLSTTNWTVQNFSGSESGAPDSRWPIWNASAGTLTSGTTGTLNEELVVLSPDQAVSRLVITKTSGNNYSTDVTFMTPRSPLTIKRADPNVILTWTNDVSQLQSTTNLLGTWSYVTNATSPYTNAETPGQKFFRLYPGP